MLCPDLNHWGRAEMIGLFLRELVDPFGLFRQTRLDRSSRVGVPRWGVSRGCVGQNSTREPGEGCRDCRPDPCYLEECSSADAIAWFVTHHPISTAEPAAE